MRLPDDSAATGGLANLRDLGGLPAADGRRLRFGALYRSEAPVLGDPPPPLRPWPPRTVIDLRSALEVGVPPHPLLSPLTRVLHIPLLPDLDPRRQSRRHGAPIELRTNYLKVLAVAAPNVAAVVEAVADSPTPLLVHCAAGKDRTGIAVAVTLAAIGVSRQAIVADYLRTDRSAGRLASRLAAGWPEHLRGEAMHRMTVEAPELMRTSRSAIEAVLDAVEGWPGGTRGWLRHHGVVERTVEVLRQRLLSEG